MSKKEEEIVLEEKPIVNGNMIEVLGRVLDFNKDYLTFLRGQLDTAKKQQLEEILDNLGLRLV